MSPRARAGTIGLVLLGLLSGLPAGAETWKGAELARKLREAPWRFGPFRIQPALVISNAGVDSNVYYSPSDPVKDFTLTAGPAATVYLPIYRKLVLSVQGSPQYVWYSKTEQERTWNYYASGAAQLSLKDVFFSLDAKYSDARERWNTEIDIRPRRIEKGYGGSALLKTSWKTSVALAYRTAEYDYESVVYGDDFDVQERLNRRESYANLSLYYQATTQRRFFLDFEYGLFDFRSVDQALIKDSRSGAAYAGLELSPFGRRVKGRVRIGYKKFDIRNPEGIDYDGLVGDAQLSVRVARPLVVRGSFVRDVQFSLWYDNPYYLESRPGAGASVYVFRFLRFDYDYGFGRNVYPMAQEVEPGVEVKRRDDFDIHSAGVYFRLWKQTALGFVASWWARDSNLQAEDDKRTFFGVNLTYEF